MEGRANFLKGGVTTGCKNWKVWGAGTGERSVLMTHLIGERDKLWDVFKTCFIVN